MKDFGTRGRLPSDRLTLASRQLCPEFPYYDREDVRSKSCVFGSWNLENDTAHGPTGNTIHRHRPPADQSRKLAERVSHPTCHTRRHPREDPREDDGVSGVSARMSRVRYEDATGKLLPWNVSFNELRSLVFEH